MAEVLVFADHLAPEVRVQSSLVESKAPASELIAVSAGRNEIAGRVAVRTYGRCPKAAAQSTRGPWSSPRTSPRRETRSSVLRASSVGGLSRLTNGRWGRISGRELR